MPWTNKSEDYFSNSEFSVLIKTYICEDYKWTEKPV